MTPPDGRVEAWPIDGVGEIVEGADLGALLCGLDLISGDVVLVTSKIISKSEGRTRQGDREQTIREETVRVVAQRGATRIVENRLGLVMAAAGVDASNVAPGHVVLLPTDPDGSARALRERVQEQTGSNIAVVITDTAGRAWRTGQTDLAIGVAGIEPLDDHAGRIDSYGNPLAVTAPAVADELASLAELVTGKLAGRPFSIVRGLGHRVLAAGAHGPGARALIRRREDDMFALGAREAVIAAVQGRASDCFGTPAEPGVVLEVMESCGLAGLVEGNTVRVSLPDSGDLDRDAAAERVRLLAHAHGWTPIEDSRGAHVGGHCVTISPTHP
ncbi:MAG: coenzyme F420-0:L-glutamate ligase [Ornithinibacter sp.]